ncbi:IS4 family transposase [Tolypothrix sp. VBCCA 56010]|uniref:IS4 family transposase n=1 Tax=Tolypothrix sp. VBCCA 56010 TaxID=3137731 RepID=UPI003D7EE930
MSEFSRLRPILGKHFQWHGARLTFLAQFLVSVIRVRSVNLSELSTAFVGKTLQASNYKRLQRFFREFRLDYAEFAYSIAAWVGIKEDWVLVLDRTQWEFGNQMHNVLMLAIAYKGVAIPLLWTLLANRSNSYSYQRKALLHRFKRIFPNQGIAYLTADREFIGKDWLSYLCDRHIRFCIRIRECDHLYDGQRSLSPRILFANLQAGEIQVLSKRRRVGGVWVFVVATRLKDGKLLVIITSEQHNSVLLDYACRWQIETLFGCLKSRGFNLEATHISRRDRLSKMLALLTIALMWSLHTGEWQHQQQKLPLKKHGRPPLSLFRLGLDFLRRALFNLDAQPILFRQSLSFLSCT